MKYRDISFHVHILQNFNFFFINKHHANIHGVDSFYFVFFMSNVDPSVLHLCLQQTDTYHIWHRCWSPEPQTAQRSETPTPWSEWGRACGAAAVRPAVTGGWAERRRRSYQNRSLPGRWHPCLQVQRKQMCRIGQNDQVNSLWLFIVEVGTYLCSCSFNFMKSINTFDTVIFYDCLPNTLISGQYF